MSEIHLEDKTINIDGEWLNSNDLKRRIQEKMESGDMKLTALANALEELNSALENAHTLEVKLILTNEDYDKLKAFGGDDDRESVRKAILNFIGPVPQPAGTPKANTARQISASSMNASAFHPSPWRFLADSQATRHCSA